ncbi:hypothetical protein MHI18_06570 [Peribacillus sp. FSL H8-0477]
MVTQDQLVPPGLFGPKNAKEIQNETIPNLFCLQTALPTVEVGGVF